jgi:polyphosphate glucokinase
VSNRQYERKEPRRQHLGAIQVGDQSRRSLNVPAVDAREADTCAPPPSAFKRCLGKEKWQRRVTDVVARLIAALEPDDVVLGGGNVKKLDELPPRCRAGSNAKAFLGGFRRWENTREGCPAACATTPQNDGAEVQGVRLG